MEALGKREKNMDEMEGPDIDSKNQMERIEARRIRIQKRIEAAKRYGISKSVSTLELTYGSSTVNWRPVCYIIVDAKLLANGS